MDGHSLGAETKLYQFPPVGKTPNGGDYKGIPPQIALDSGIIGTFAQIIGTRVSTVVELDLFQCCTSKGLMWVDDTSLGYKHIIIFIDIERSFVSENANISGST